MNVFGFLAAMFLITFICLAGCAGAARIEDHYARSNGPWVRPTVGRGDLACPSEPHTAAGGSPLRTVEPIPVAAGPCPARPSRQFPMQRRER